MTLVVGDRIQVNRDFATVRFIGFVDGSKGEWLGVQWDDPTRGKHDGSHNGKRYFTSSSDSETSCSFIRFHPTKVHTAQPFLQVLMEKYLDDGTTTSNDPEKDLGHVYFGGNKNLVVETVGFDKVQRKQSQLNSLTVVGLANLYVGSAGVPGEIIANNFRIRDLDLSKSLIRCWDTLADIVSQLPSLYILRLNYCRLESPPEDPTLLYRNNTSPFTTLTTLALSNTLTTWSQVAKLEPLLPNLQDLQLGQNQIETILDVQSDQFQQLQCINLENNHIQQWQDIQSLGNLKSLEILYLNGNKIPSIEPISEGMFASLIYLRIENNLLNQWSSWDRLNVLPSLKKLRSKGNPLFNETKAEDFPAHVVGRIHGLTVVDGNTLTGRERMDFERYYLKLCTSDAPTHEEISKIHPRYEELCDAHGEPELSTKSEKATLSDRLIGVTLTHRSDLPMDARSKSELGEPIKTIEKRLLRTMLIRNLRNIVQKLFRIPASRQQLYLLQHSPTGELMIMDLGDELRDLRFYSVEQGDEIVAIKDQ
ncbi:hypothetical protein BDA99DRAFT_508948 [Phascolomyces articulosus]|uniref:CAP-Gly domain-containing protein n=1 Tax=Phascolomyces articulosus TaxID=60185 RepID=A0AAD5K1A2_9FUNG|nr:hypothetical protein BDA99DRAFT_508948 [Phascolomyces articulosus]